MAKQARGWKSPDPGKKRRNAKAQKHAAPKVNRPKPLGFPNTTREKIKVASLVARGAAEIVYEPTHPAPLPIPGVLVGGCHEQKLLIPKRDRKRIRKAIASMTAGPDSPKVHKPRVRIRIGRRGTTVVIPLTRPVQDALVKVHSTNKPTEKTNPVVINRVNLDRMSKRATKKYACSDEGQINFPELYKTLVAEKEVAREKKIAAHETLPGDWYGVGKEVTSYERKLAMCGKLTRKTNPEASKSAKAWAAARKEHKKAQRAKALKAV
jgi:hypothetical protein